VKTTIVKASYGDVCPVIRIQALQYPCMSHFAALNLPISHVNISTPISACPISVPLYIFLLTFSTSFC